MSTAGKGWGKMGSRDMSGICSFIIIKHTPHQLSEVVVLCHCVMMSLICWPYYQTEMMASINQPNPNIRNGAFLTQTILRSTASHMIQLFQADDLSPWIMLILPLAATISSPPAPSFMNTEKNEAPHPISVHSRLLCIEYHFCNSVGV